ncbi:MAG: hypothetical protein ACLQOO_11330, partial [Terriglobia bacterium]
HGAGDGSVPRTAEGGQRQLTSRYRLSTIVIVGAQGIAPLPNPQPQPASSPESRFTPGEY